MKRLLISLSVLASLACNAQQDTTSYDGEWVAEWKTVAGRPASASLVLRNGAGTWQVRVFGRVEDPCVKVAAPAKLDLSEEQLYLAIDPSAVISGCPNSRLKLGKPGEGSLRGNWSDGREVVLTKR